jgi:putative phosphoserine phosphatase/1-acylglycerol-3-phosphate O-acyltransferase
MNQVIIARNAAGILGIVPAAVAGTAIGTIRGKRAGFDATLPLWLDWYLASTGVKVEVVSGQGHLEAPRPAVFVFNHKNNWDSFVVGSLVRTNFTAVAKKELERDPIFGTFGRLLDLAFVDRSGAVSPAEQLRDIENLARKGLSIIVAPEGTRSEDGNLGPFKKGAFRIAMATGLPVVPIVVRNAEVLGAHDSKFMGSGCVEVAVLPPIPVTDWTLESLEHHIGEVRARFVDTLRRWPA